MNEVPERRSILRVDLTESTVEHEPVPPSWLEAYLGGKGVAARYLYETVDQTVDPTSPSNVLCFMVGPLSGYLPGEVRYAAVTKSPLTGLFLDSYAGGAFAEALAGALGEYMGVLVTGRAKAPVTLRIEDAAASLEPADDIWGLDAHAVDAAMDGATACVGPAGEQEVRFATIASDGGAHQAGRGGAGAVMGGKRLKAIVARGSIEVPPAMESIKQAYESRLREAHEGRWHRSGGTLETIDAADALGVLPTAGWRRGSFDGAEQLGIDAMRARATDRERSGDVPGDFVVDDVSPRGALGISLGANLGIDDLDAVVHLGDRCDRLGIDVIETGNAIAWAMRAADADIIDRRMPFGDADAAAQLLEEIASRSTPLGDRLATGIDHAATVYGGDALIPTVKSMSAATYDPRRSPAMALAYATSDRGACHRRSRPVFDERLDEEEWTDARRVSVVTAEQDRRSLLWCYIADDVTAAAFDDDLGLAYFDALGIEIDRNALVSVGERVWTLTRLFNVREGVDRAADSLPPAFEAPMDDTGAAIDPAAFDRLRRRYYAVRGWDETGRPTPGLLDRLGLNDVEVPSDAFERSR